MMKKKFAELELSLLLLQQIVEIPVTLLKIHPVIQGTVEQVIRCFRCFFSFYFTKGFQGTCNWDTTKYLTNPCQTA